MGEIKERNELIFKNWNGSVKQVSFNIKEIRNGFHLKKKKNRETV